MPSAESFLDFRMWANHERIAARQVRVGPCFDVLVRVHQKAAERWEQSAQDELDAMEAEATKAGKSISFPLSNGIAITVNPNTSDAP